MVRLLLPLAFLLRQRNAEGQDGKKKKKVCDVLCLLCSPNFPVAEGPLPGIH